jgi:hypothetical protein
VFSLMGEFHETVLWDVPILNNISLQSAEHEEIKFILFAMMLIGKKEIFFFYFFPEKCKNLTICSIP